MSKYYDFMFKLTGGRSTTIFGLFPFRFQDWYSKYIRVIYDPQHTRLRKAIPRRWTDISHLIVEVNFEFIRSFVEDELCNVNWEATEEHSKFHTWIRAAYKYITIERPHLDKELWAAYPDIGITDKRFSEIPYEELYREVNRIEKEIADKDTEVLIRMIGYRDYFWT